MTATLPAGWWRHKTTARFPRRRLLLEQALAEFAAEGPVAIERARAMRTTTYLKLCACLLGPDAEDDEEPAP